MGIAHYIREIGRGKQGAKHLTREQACDLMLQVLKTSVEPVALGAFCVAMRIKGETADEMLGFLDAIHTQLTFFKNTHAKPVVVLPSYNGSRRLPLLTPLLAKLLAQQGHGVLIHGCQSEDARVTSEDLLPALGIQPASQTSAIEPGEVVFVPTALLSQGLWSLLQVRRQTGLRNSGHSLVKLLNPVAGPSLQVASYTHPEYAISMQETLQRMHAHAMLLRGTEGEPVADPRKTPSMRCLVSGEMSPEFHIEADVQHQTVDLPTGMDTRQSMQFMNDLLSGKLAIPPSLLVQIDVINRLSLACTQETSRTKPK